MEVFSSDLYFDLSVLDWQFSFSLHKCFLTLGKKPSRPLWTRQCPLKLDKARSSRSITFVLPWNRPLPPTTCTSLALSHQRWLLSWRKCRLKFSLLWTSQAWFLWIEQAPQGSPAIRWCLSPERFILYHSEGILCRPLLSPTTMRLTTRSEQSERPWLLKHTPRIKPCVCLQTPVLNRRWKTGPKCRSIWRYAAGVVPTVFTLWLHLMKAVLNIRVHTKSTRPEALPDDEMSLPSPTKKARTIPDSTTALPSPNIFEGHSLYSTFGAPLSNLSCCR